MGNRLVPFIPDDYIEFENLSADCIEGISSEIPSFVPPIGFVYTQYYGCSAPWEIFPSVIESSWKKLYDTEGLFFCTEGGESPAFNGTIKSDQFQGHCHGVSQNSDSLEGGPSVRRTSMQVSTQTSQTLGPISDGTNGTPRTGATTRPKSVTVRVWKRIS